MSKQHFVAVLVVLASLFSIIACSDEGQTPAAQPTAEATATRAPEATATPAPMATPRPTATATPQTDSLEAARSLAPLNMDDPQTFLSALSAQEQSCLSARNLGIAQIMTAMTSTDGSPEGDAILDCLEDETVLPLFLSDLLTATGELSNETSTCVLEGLGGMDLRSVMKSSDAEAVVLDEPVTGMASFLTFTACLNDEEWEAASSALELGPRDKSGTDCLLAELGGATGVAEALLRTDESGLPRDFFRAAAKCGVGFAGMSGSVPAESGSGSTTPTPIPTQVAKSYAPQPHIMLRVVLVTEDWTPFAGRGGWMSAVLQRESASLRFYEAAIWEEIDAVHLYAFTNDFDPYFGSGDSATPEEIIANREKYAIKRIAGLPERDTEERSAFLREVFEEFASILVRRHPDAQHHLMFSGHGGPSGDLFSSQLANADADSFLGTWTRLLGKKLGVIDMGGPCNKGSYVDLDNFCKHARYYVASDLPNGGFVMDEWDVDKYNETDAETQYHHILAESATLEDALKARIGLRRTLYEYSRNNQTENKVQQSNYVYSCPAFADFRQAFETFVKETDVAYPQWDLYDTLVTYDAPPALLEKFDKVIVHSVDNRDFFEWTFRANGIISPRDLFYRIGR